MPKSRRPTQIRYKSLRVLRRVFKLPLNDWHIINQHAKENKTSTGYLVLKLVAQVQKETIIMTKLKFNSGLYGIANIYGVVALLKVWRINRILEQ